MSSPATSFRRSPIELTPMLFEVLAMLFEVLQVRMARLRGNFQPKHARFSANACF